MKTTDDVTAPGGHTLTELCALTDLSPRTVRYYVQLGLVDRPEGETRAARYGQRQLEQLLRIRKWSEAGLALERIRELLRGEPPPAPPRRVGTLSVCSHLLIGEGLELVIDPERAGLTPAQLRAFSRAVLAAYRDIQAGGPQTGTQENGDDEQG